MGKKQVPYHISGKDYVSSKLSLEQIREIIEDYPNISNKELSKKYNIGVTTIVCIAYHYTLKKSTDIIGRNLNFKDLKQIALLYSTKREFYYKDPSAYSKANKLGVMDEITKHMVNLSFSVPQIILKQITEKLFQQKCEYNTRRVIKPYEIDVYYPNFKLGFEYDGKGWHEGDSLDKKNVCEKQGIKLLILKERSRNYLEDIQTYLIENLEYINNITKCGITIYDILSFNDPIDFPKLFTDEELKILRNNNTTYLRENYNSLYQRYKKYNPDNKKFSVFKYSEEDILLEINKYNSEGELLNNSPRIYNIIYKRYRHLLPIYNKGRKKSIICTDTGQEFKSITEASIVLGICKSSISKVINGERHKAGGKHFKNKN